MPFSRSTDEGLEPWWPLKGDEGCVGLALVGEEGIRASLLGVSTRSVTVTVLSISAYHSGSGQLPSGNERYEIFRPSGQLAMSQCKTGEEEVCTGHC